jgi:L-lactate dehydrogenase complex protein LldG
MASSSTAVLERVRRALHRGRPTARVEEVPPRGSVGYQGGGEFPAATFREGFVAAGGQLHLVTNAAATVATVCALIQKLAVRKLLVGRGPFVNSLGLEPHLSALDVEMGSPDSPVDALFAADASVTGVSHLIAETGTLVVRSAPQEPRSLTLLPPIHIAVAHEDQIVPDLFDLFGPNAAEGLPSCLTLITGPSKTGDIELQLVTGVHGPGQLHVVLVAPSLV